MRDLLQHRTGEGRGWFGGGQAARSCGKLACALCKAIWRVFGPQLACVLTTTPLTNLHAPLPLPSHTPGSSSALSLQQDGSNAVEVHGLQKAFDGGCCGGRGCRGVCW